MYEAFYKLNGKPFQLTPDPDLLFPSRGHKRAMSYLLYGLEQAEGFVVITGAVGTGKTLLVQALLHKLASRHMAVANIASANLDGPEVLPAVASAFKLPYEGRSKEELLQAIKRHLVFLRANRIRALLVVDEAQTLTPTALEVLRILSNLETHGMALLQVFMVGQTKLRRMIIANHMEQLRQRIIVSYQLDALLLEESEAYILHRLRAVGWRDDPVLSPGLFVQVHRSSGGIPRRINLLMDRLLLYGYLEERHTLDQHALAVVLEEMHEEIAGVPAAPETHEVQKSPHPRRRAGISERMNQLIVLEQNLKDLLRQMQEHVRQKQLPGSGPPHRTTSEVTPIHGVRHIGTKR